jgi:hypothetical protein
MYGMNGMGWGMGLTGLLVLVLLVLGIAALVKYLSGRDCEAPGDGSNPPRLLRRHAGRSRRRRGHAPVWKASPAIHRACVGRAAGAKRFLVLGEMRRELIPAIFRVEFLDFGMIAANNHQAG